MTSQKEFYTIISLIYSWNVSSMVIDTVLSVREIYLTWLYLNQQPNLKLLQSKALYFVFLAE